MGFQVQCKGLAPLVIVLRQRFKGFMRSGSPTEKFAIFFPVYSAQYSSSTQANPAALQATPSSSAHLIVTLASCI